MRLFGKEWNRKQLVNRVGRWEQLASVRRLQIEEGAGRGMSVAQFDLADGLSFSVLLDRCLDISRASYRGVPLSWFSRTGEVAPSRFEPQGTEWLRSFFGGLLTTCGFSNVGPPEEVQGEQLGLHGRASSLPAEQIKTWQEWVDDEQLELGVEGVVREAKVFGSCIELRRRITARLGELKIKIEDEACNCGFSPAPFMLLYHINPGFPLVDKETELVGPIARVTPRDEEAKKGFKTFHCFHEPVKDYKEQVFFLELKATKKGQTRIALINGQLAAGEQGVGIALSFSRKELPQFTVWKQLGEGTYVVGLEPGNCYPLGQNREKKEGRLVTLAPGERYRSGVEISVLAGTPAIAKFRQASERLRKAT